LVKQDFGITLKDLDEILELTSYFLSPTGPTHLDKLLFESLNLHTSEGTGILPNSLLHLKRWGNHLHSYKTSTTDNQLEFSEFRKHSTIATLQEAFQVIKGKEGLESNCTMVVQNTLSTAEKNC